MKKSVILSLLFLSLNGLYAMGGGEPSTFPYDELPKDMDHEIMSQVPQDQMPVKAEDAVQHVAQYAHDSIVRSVAVFPDGLRVVSGGYDQRVKIKSVVPLLLATHQLKRPSLAQYLLLKRLQEKLLREKEPLIVGESGKGTLEEMPELKKLLSITPSKPGAQHLAWRLQLKRFGGTISQGGGQPAAHAGDRLSDDPEEEE